MPQLARDSDYLPPCATTPAGADDADGIGLAHGGGRGDREERRGRHVIVTANAAWNVLNFRKPVVEALQSDGCQVTVLAPEDEAVPALVEMGCRFIPLAMDNKGLSPLRDVALLGRFLSVLQRERPDAVLGYTIKNNVYGALAARLLGIPFLPNVSGLGTGFLGKAWLRTVVEALYRLAFARVPVVFFQNEDDRALFIEAGLVEPARTRCLPGSGIDLVTFAPGPERPSAADAPVFLMIARLLRDKGVIEFVEAARIVKRRHPDAVFQLLGGLGAENRTAIPAEVVAQWCDEGVVTHLGQTDDVRPFIAASDCVVLPSYREGRPRSLIEAAAMARPLIATDVPGCRDVVDHGGTGFLCRVKDAADLAQWMEAFIALDAAERAKLGAAGRAKMEREYDAARIVAAYRRELAALTVKPAHPQALSRPGVAGGRDDDNESRLERRAGDDAGGAARG